MATGWSTKLTGQAGEFLVCAELARRGIIATPFAGNVPGFDLLATDDTFATLPVQVKTSRGESWPSRVDLWMRVEMGPNGRQIYKGPVELENPGLIYVCVALATASSNRDRFFVLRKRDLQAICIRNYSEWMGTHNWTRPRKPESMDTRYTVGHLAPFEDKWETITAELESRRVVPAADDGESSTGSAAADSTT